MTAAVTIPYLGNKAEICPLCHKREVGRKKLIYGHPVCKKCLYAFANRRQLAYLIDSLLFAIPIIFVNLAIVRMLQSAGLIGISLTIATVLAAIPLQLLFIMKDGFTGQSPGKRVTSVQAIDNATDQPIGFKQSFKRNAFLLFGLIPYLGGVIALTLIIVIATQVGKGMRLGDRFARSRVIWKKYAQSPVFGGEALVCEKCGYDLNGNVSGICPECGTPLSQQNLDSVQSAVASA